MTQGDPEIVRVGIPFIAALVTSLVLLGVRRATGRLLVPQLVAFTWWVITGALAATGKLANFDARPPPMAVMIVLVLALGLGLGLSPLGARLRDGLPLGAIVLLQAFRLPLELVMHHAGSTGLMPVELSFSGLNFDIVTGSLAVVVGVLALRGKAPTWLVWVWNLIGIAALAMIAFIAVATSPMVHLFGEDPRHLNTWVTRVPYVWLPTVLVVVAIASHVVVTRALLARPRRDAVG